MLMECDPETEKHVQKGYRIAKATPELNIVAAPILLN